MYAKLEYSNISNSFFSFETSTLISGNFMLSYDLLGSMDELLLSHGASYSGVCGRVDHTAM